MANPVVYDKAKWHYGGDYPADFPISQAFVHTGMFLAWIVDHDLYSPEFAEEFAQEIAAVKTRTMSGAQLLEAADGVFADDMLSEEGNAFTRDYFDFEHGAYLSDYQETLGANLPSLYHVQDTWENYDKLRAVIDRRYADWRRRR